MSSRERENTVFGKRRMEIMESGSADIIILTYKPDERFFRQIEMLQKQTVRPGRIIVMNTEEKYMLNLLRGTTFVRDNPDVFFYNVSKREFDHGKTRNMGAARSEADFIVFMTQDAMPADEELLSELLRPMEDPDTAVSYARQLPYEDADPVEQYNRLFNYPGEDRVQTLEDLPSRGIKTYFCSDVCACYRHGIFRDRGGFETGVIFNEDMVYAAGVIRDGMKVYYASRARVFHSHHYTAGEQYRRNFDLGVSQADHPEIFSGLQVTGEGKKLVKGCLSHLLKEKRFFLIPGFFLHCLARYLGYRSGKRYRKLSKKTILKRTQNREYWLRHWDRAGMAGKRQSTDF